MESAAFQLIDRGLLPDVVLRPIVRQLCRQRQREITRGTLADQHARKMAFIEALKAKPIAEQQAAANEQHYEVSTEFIKSCTGPFMKYSSCLFPTGKETLEAAEVLMFEDYCRKAHLADGMDILDLGCGWGSLSLYLAQRFPNARIKSLSNSRTQKQYIDATAKERNLKNLEVFTGDVSAFDFPKETRFDRILSIEMFEHMKNYEMLFAKVNSWLKSNNKAQGSQGALLFVHIFCHKSQPYDFLPEDGWMARYFFSGGTMPSHDLFSYFQKDVCLLQSWWIAGSHYQQTLESWLKLQDAHSSYWLSEKGAQVMLDGKGSLADAQTLFYRFRLFFLSCAEFFGLDNGDQWGVGHYLFQKRD